MFQNMNVVCRNQRLGHWEWRPKTAVMSKIWKAVFGNDLEFITMTLPVILIDPQCVHGVCVFQNDYIYLTHIMQSNLMVNL